MKENRPRMAIGLIVFVLLVMFLVWSESDVDWVVEYDTYGCEAPTIWECHGDAMYLGVGQVVRVESCRVAWDDVDGRWRVFAVVDGHYFGGLAAACW